MYIAITSLFKSDLRLWKSRESYVRDQLTKTILRDSGNVLVYRKLITPIHFKENTSLYLSFFFLIFGRQSASAIRVKLNLRQVIATITQKHRGYFASCFSGLIFFCCRSTSSTSLIPIPASALFLDGIRGNFSVVRWSSYGHSLFSLNPDGKVKGKNS